jgi:hypothetical protein
MTEKCPDCGEDLEFDEVDIGVGSQRGNYRCLHCRWTPERRRLTRQEQLEGLADRGVDTWEELRGER